MNIRKAILIFICMFYSCSSRFFDVTPDDIYVNRLIYLKSTNRLFTGVIRDVNGNSTTTYSICNGKPCGDWEYRFKGDLIHKGKILDGKLLSAKSIALFKTDTFDINSWQESELPDILYPPFLTVSILKTNSFFDTGRNTYNNYISQIAFSVKEDLKSKGIKYDVLTIILENQIFDSDKWIKISYRLANDSLIVRNSENSFE